MDIKQFIEDDMNKYAVTHTDLPTKDIFKPSNDGKLFISIDMRKANFSALKNYDSGIFDSVDTWEEFISRYTDNKHIINSKYIRQVILGNCNPKRQVTYENILWMEFWIIHRNSLFQFQIVFSFLMMKLF